MKANKERLATLLSRIAKGEVSPKTLLTPKTEIWVTTSLLTNGVYVPNGIYVFGEKKLTEQEFETYVQTNPNIDTLVIQALNTGVPLARSEAEIQD
jgi:hypothetical protein